MARMDHLGGFAVFGLSLFFFQLDDVETKLALDHVADLAGLQSVSRLLKFRNHIAMAKPAEVAAFLLAAGIAGKLLSQLTEIFAGARALERFFRRRAIL